jgi:hypothetical protein
VVGAFSGSGGLVVGTNGTQAYVQLNTGGGTIQQRSLLVNIGSTVDITNYAIAVSYGTPANDPITQIVGYLATGRLNGTWTGTGIVSSDAAASALGSGQVTSVGYADSATDGNDPFPIPGLGTNQILIRYAEAGDANLDGRVDFEDYATVIANFGQTGTDWAHGNFLYGTGTSFLDYAAVIANFGQPLPPASGSTALTAGGNTISLAGSVRPITENVGELPEPSSMALLAVSAGLLVRRRRVPWRAHRGQT